MANLITYANTLLKPYYKYITGIVLLILFILVSKFVYETYFVKYNKNKALSERIQRRFVQSISFTLTGVLIA